MGVKNMKTAYLHCSLLSGKKDMKSEENMTVVVEDGKIIEIGKDLPAPDDAKAVVDVGGKFLMPGLINLHVHLPGSGYPKKKSTDTKKLAEFVMSTALTRKIAVLLSKKYAKVELMSGTTTIRTVGGLGSVDSMLRDRSRKKNKGLPRIVSSDTAITVFGGHMEGSVAKAVSSEWESRKLVEETSKKSDWIKLMITGGVLDATEKGEAGVLRMPPEYVLACTEEAHKHGKKVCAHVESEKGVLVALENGVDCIEHGATCSDKTMDLFKEKGAYLVETISPAIPFSAFPEKLTEMDEIKIYNGKLIADGVINCAKKALERGIKVGIGTDTACPYSTHYDLWRELEYYHHFVGVSRAFALYSATLGNAEILGLDDRIGSIEVGKSADFVIVKDNPLDGFETIRNPEMVVLRGRIYKKPKVKKSAVCEAQLDKLLSELKQSKQK